ncbi:hypothetical protein HZA97_00760 [Candidatus Woesearchaeota archaeon]|nr:hypothetical protein [Candidatus Woesearchaeota archaeon]
MNKVWLDNEPQLSGEKIIEIDIFVKKLNGDIEVENLKEYLEYLRKEVRKYQEIFKDYDKRFGVRFEPFFHTWNHDGFYFLKLQELYQAGNISQITFEALKKEYTEETNGNSFHERIKDLELIYHTNQKHFTNPVIYCGLFDYYGCEKKNLNLGLALLGAPFMTVSLKSQNFKNLFRHELNHCLGASHYKVPFNIMYPYIDKQKNIVLGKTKKEIKKTIKKTYDKPYKVLLIPKPKKEK